MTAERLHFKVESPVNFVKLACTILLSGKRNCWKITALLGTMCLTGMQEINIFNGSWKTCFRTAALLGKAN